MTAVKTLRERERELQTQILAPGGRAALDHIAEAYAAAGGGPVWHTSVITYILVYERVQGLIRL
jgi:hypothetical protein